MQDGKSYVKKINGVIAFNIKDGPGGKTGKWVVDGKNGNGSVEFNSDSKLDYDFEFYTNIKIHEFKKLNTDFFDFMEILNAFICRKGRLHDYNERQRYVRYDDGKT